MENDNIFNHPDLQDIEARTEKNWQRVQESLSEATFAVCEEDIQPGPNFWSEHTEYIKNLNEETRDELLNHAERINDKKRYAEQREAQSLEEKEGTLSKLRRFGRTLLHQLRNDTDPDDI